MTDEEFLKGLRSRLPSDRMHAAQWATERSPLSGHLKPELVNALASERVPQIRQRLIEAVRATESTQRGDGPQRSSLVADQDGGLLDPAHVLNDLAGMIAHEMSPAVGWVRHAANSDIDNFSASATNSMIEALKRRVDGLVKIASASRLPSKELVPLHEILSSQVGFVTLGAALAFEPPTVPDDTISTDLGLFSLILENALQNAVDATRDMPNDGAQVLVTSGVTDKSFWVRITNRFVGAGFEYASVSATGRSSKANHRGLGTRVMEVAATRLGYQIDVRAAGGVATFSLYGSRHV